MNEHLMRSEFYKLMLVTHRQQTPISNYLNFIKQCISSGVTCVQLREKNSHETAKLEFALGLKELLDAYQIPLIINDDVNLAIKINADGVHLGQTDKSPLNARELLGNNRFIGLSIEAEDNLIQANNVDLAYVAASAVFPSQHKNNLKKIWNIHGLTHLCAHSKHPVIGIGGINQNNLPNVLAAGAQGVAVIGALHQAANPAEMALTLRKIIDQRIF
ncbi:thiamine phosphate synthase [Legionella worsleiensis]|uniref:Thiamine-phosphate synthase n=1 Tax=Legionella worsleiensis TaxID=45076 RepID=A0A0W1A3L9_9GAMM|nr:thiamine phosphate synthase [Legionella worsleiensis]KTD75947.1 phosphomethylpyrimidine kinase/thiamin-phosphate pyrophosphorylase [Legionella worsleiensis]STY32960.1 phosphomethylpyrimidine kinase/thiamin-phosphate pyrophosphorylase [Legionella worsleiensis]